MAEDVTLTLDLVREAKSGDAEALNRLFGRYYERVRRIVRLRLGARLRTRLDSSDILQDTFAAAVTAFDRFELRDEGSVINWLSRIAERQVLAAADHFGAQKRSAAREVPLAGPHVGDETSAIGLDPSATGLAPRDAAEKAELIRLIEERLAELPESYREVILLRNYAGMSWDDVARETGRPSADAARMMHAKAIIELSRAVQDPGT